MKWIAIAMLLVAGCDKPKPVSPQKVEKPVNMSLDAPLPRPASLTDRPWRMVATSDPEMLAMDDKTYRLLTFFPNFTAKMERFIQGTKVDELTLNFRYNLYPFDSQSGRIVLSDENGNWPEEFRYAFWNYLVLTGVNIYFSYTYAPD